MVAAYWAMSRPEVITGRLIAVRKGVVEATVANTRAGSNNACQRSCLSLSVGGQRSRVIGVMEKKGQMLGFDLDDIVYIPVDKALQMFNREGLMEVDVVVSAATSSERMSEIIRKNLTS